MSTSVKSYFPRENRVYDPRAIRGIKYPGHTKISINQAKRVIAERPFVGFIVGNKVAPSHFFGGWRLACPIRSATLEDFTRQYNSFKFYLDPELGNRVSIYLKNNA